MDKLLIPTTEPFFFPGGKVGCLLIHGFTGTPKEMRWIGEYLAEQGFTVLGVRLAGHATSPEDMERTCWRDWVASVEDGWNLLCGVVEHVFPIGLSMGGALALYTAARLPTAGVITLSTPISLPDVLHQPFAEALSSGKTFIPKGPPDWHDPLANLDHISYSVYPRRSIGEMSDLLTEVQTILPQVKVPVLLVHSQQDFIVPAENMEKIYQRLGSDDKRMLWLVNSGHVVTREPERKYLFRETADFIRCVMQEGQ